MDIMILAVRHITKKYWRLSLCGNRCIM